MKPPKGYKLIAVSDLKISTSKAYFNPDTREAIFIVDDVVKVGPIKKDQMESLRHVMTDVIEMKGHIIFLE